jgi:hypothetical protein
VPPYTHKIKEERGEKYLDETRNKKYECVYYHFVSDVSCWYHLLCLLGNEIWCLG